MARQVSGIGGLDIAIAGIGTSALLAALVVAAVTGQQWPTTATFAVIVAVAALCCATGLPGRFAACCAWLVCSACAAYLAHLVSASGTAPGLAETLAASAAILGAASLLLRAFAPPGRRELSVRWPYPASAAVAAAAVVALASTWYSGDLTDRFLDATTAVHPVADQGGDGPKEPGRVLWTVPTSGPDDLAEAAAGEVLAWRHPANATGGPTGVVGYDARTGHERWHYLRDDRPLDRVGIDPARHVAVLRTGHRFIAVDLTSGDVRWQISADGEHAYLAGPVLLITGATRGVPVVGYDAGTGRRLWSHRPNRSQCAVADATADGRRTVLAWSCLSAARPVSLLEAVSPQGTTVWSTVEPASGNARFGDLPAVDHWLVSVAGVVMHSAYYDSRSKHPNGSVITAYRGDTGAVRWTDHATSEHALPAGTALIESDAQRLRLRDPNTGQVRRRAAAGGWSLSRGTDRLYLTGAGATRGVLVTVADDTTLAIRGSAEIPLSGCPAGAACSPAVMSTTPTAGVLLIAPTAPSPVHPVVVGEGGAFRAARHDEPSGDGM